MPNISVVDDENRPGRLWWRYSGSDPRLLMMQFSAMPFWSFGKKKRPTGTMEFKDPEAFFRFQCKYGRADIQAGIGLVAIVLDTGQRAPVQIQPDGSQLTWLKVVSKDGGFMVRAATPPGSEGDRLCPGDIVMWVPSYNSGVPTGDDRRSAWVGVIRAKVEWKFGAPGERLDLICRYD